MNNNIRNITIVIDTNTSKQRKTTTQQPVLATRVRLYKRQNNNKEKEMERKKNERKKSEKELNKPVLNKYIRRAVTDEDENYDNNDDDAVVFLGR